MKIRIHPAWFLFFLSPAIGELLSGSAPPAEFFQPIGFAMLTILYGGGALLIREYAIRRQLGWPAIFMLGAAYGIAEEGLMCMSFFDPKWMDLGILGTYGRAYSVNWVWAAELTVYHSIFSIAIPIALVHLVYPERAIDRWMSNRSLFGMALIWILNGIFINRVISLMITKYQAPIGHVLISLGIVVLLIPLAEKLPAAFGQPGEKPRARPIRFGLLGFIGTVAFFFVLWVLPNTGIPPVGTVAILIALIGLFAWLILRWSGNGFGWDGRHQLALIFGALMFFILLAPLMQMDKNAKDNRSGMWIVALITLILLLRLRTILSRRYHLVAHS